VSRSVVGRRRGSPTIRLSVRASAWLIWIRSSRH
jgi:hypothetical protein